MCNHTAQASAHHACAEDGDLKCPHLLNIDGDIWLDRWLVCGRTWGWRSCGVCAKIKLLGKIQSNLMDHGGRRRHTAAMGPHSRQQSTQQSTYIICNGTTSLKLEKKIFITSNMAINAHRIDDNEQRRQCSDAMMGALQPAG